MRDLFPSVILLFAMVLATAAATAQEPLRGLRREVYSADPERAKAEGHHAQVVRLMSLHVERGETLTPFVGPGMFKADFAGTLTLPLRDSYRFRAEGRGTVTLKINGEDVLSGALRPGKPIDSKEIRLKKGANQVTATFESTPFGDGTLRVSWAGPDFALEPIATEMWQTPDDAALQQGRQLDAGHELFAARRCAQCHIPEHEQLGTSAFGELDNDGPDLRLAGARLRTAWIADMLMMKRADRPGTEMPQIRMQQDEADALAVWLASHGKPMPAPAFTDAQREAGAGRFLQLGCVACHIGPDEPAEAAQLGDRRPLAQVRRKFHAQGLIDFLRDPDANYRHVRMPDFALTADEAAELAAFLLAGQAEPDREVKGDAAVGRALSMKLGCVRCHEIDMRDELDYRRLEQLKPDRGCLAAELPAGAPDHTLDSDQRAAIGSYLPHAMRVFSNVAPADLAMRRLQSLRCTSCHGLDSVPSTWALVTRKLGESDPVLPEHDPVAQGVPALSQVGGKLQPSWMGRFVTGKEKSPRPWLHARMPAFAQSGEVVVRGLARLHGYGDRDEDATPVDPGLVVHGRRLVKLGEGFGCVQCHGVGDQPPLQVFERQGINFSQARERVRKEYYMRWLLDPLRIDPEARMTKYADAKGKTPIGDVLEGDAAKQFDAIWHYLRSL